MATPGNFRVSVVFVLLREGFDSARHARFRTFPGSEMNPTFLFVALGALTCVLGREWYHALCGLVMIGFGLWTGGHLPLDAF